MDSNAQRREYYFISPPLAWRLIKDERDLPMLHMLWNCACITLPGAALVFAFPSCWLGALYCLCNMALLQERFILGQHYMTHRGLFKSKWLDVLVLGALTPFFGIPSGLYHAHHCVMHHCENNLRGWDLSSTEPYQRDNLAHFIVYWLRFLFLVWFELPLYALRRGRPWLALRVVLCEAAYFAALRQLFVWSPTAAHWVFVVPTITNSLLLMFGNWCQHMFVDPERPRCNFGLAYNVIHHPCNQRSFNDGYHVEHHINSQRHWSELPAAYEANKKAYKDHDAITFQGLDFFQVGFLVFAGRYDVLDHHLVKFNEREGCEAFLRRRLRPVC
jgi:fatty acid desaturase